MVAATRFSVAVFVACATLATAQGSNPELRTRVFGQWEVVQVICPTCGSETRSENSSLIAFGRENITNPFGGNCAESPGYNLLHQVSTMHLLKTKGKSWPKELTSQLKGEKSLLYGYVTCKGMNHMRMIFAGKDRAYYFWEGDSVFVLGRKH